MNFQILQPKAYMTNRDYRFLLSTLAAIFYYQLTVSTCDVNNFPLSKNFFCLGCCRFTEIRVLGDRVESFLFGFCQS